MTFDEIKPGQTFKHRNGKYPEITITVLRKTASRIVYNMSGFKSTTTVSLNTFNADYIPA